MKKGIYALLVGTTALFMTACSGNTTEGEETPAVAQACFYKYDSLSTIFEWTAYKTASKVPVKGSFNEIEISAPALSSDDPMALLKSLRFKMRTATVETNDEDRNLKIANSFFGTMHNPEYLSGKVKALKDDGTAIISVTMNDVTANVEGNYTFANDKFTFEANIDVLNFNGTAPLESLTEVCSEPHTGDDGKPITWPEVALMFSTVLDSDCD